MKSIKVFYMGRPLREVYPHATRWQVLKWKTQEFLKAIVRFLFKVGMIGGIGYSLFMAGAYFNPVVSYAVQEKQVLITKDVPIMDRIAGCESEGNPNSKGSHFGKNGQVRTHANTNGTTDIGRYMINNDVWGAKATSLGYNIFTDKGNHDMAYWIYENKGTVDWSASARCWQR